MPTWIPAVAIPLIVFLLFVLVPGIRELPWSAARIVGGIVAGAGYVLACLARVQLGASFAVRPQARTLVTHGLYSRFRNPMYVFVDTMLFGLTLVFEAYWLFLLLAALMVFQTIQARREAAVLQQKFGQAYLDYRRQT